MSVLKLIYEIPDPKNFETYPVSTDTVIRAVLYSCGCVYRSHKLRVAVLFPQICKDHGRSIIGYWTHLSLRKKKLKAIKYILRGDKE